MPPTPTCARSRLIHDYALNEPIELDDPDLSNERDRLHRTLTKQPYPLHNLHPPQSPDASHLPYHRYRQPSTLTL